MRRKEKDRERRYVLSMYAALCLNELTPLLHKVTKFFAFASQSIVPLRYSFNEVVVRNVPFTILTWFEVAPYFD